MKRVPFLAATLLPLPHAVDDWLDALHLGCLDDIFTREAERVLNLIIELDGLRTFALGAPGRPNSWPSSARYRSAHQHPGSTA